MISARASIRTLASAVAFVGIAAASLRQSGPMADRAVFSLVLAILARAALLAWIDPTPARVYWKGALLAGGLYLAAAQVPALETRLITADALDWALAAPEPSQSELIAQERLRQLSRVIRSPNDPALNLLRQRLGELERERLARTPGVLAQITPNPERSRAIAHSLIAWLLAAFGGWLAQRIDPSRRVPTGASPS